jgi:hypothetical protein
MTPVPVLARWRGEGSEPAAKRVAAGAALLCTSVPASVGEVSCAVKRSTGSEVLGFRKGTLGVECVPGRVNAPSCEEDGAVSAGAAAVSAGSTVASTSTCGRR